MLQDTRTEAADKFEDKGKLSSGGRGLNRLMGWWGDEKQVWDESSWSGSENQRTLLGYCFVKIKVKLVNEFM